MRLATGLALLACLVAACQTSPLSAQVDTGRRRAVASAPTRHPAPQDGAQPGWFFAAGFGLMTGGDLFQVRHRQTVSWLAPSGSQFLSNDFVVTLDEDIDLAVTAGRRLGDRTWLRLHLSSAAIAMTALARIGQGAEVHRWDTLNVVILGLDLEYRLVQQPHFPYLLAGGAAVAVRGSQERDTDQSRLGVRFGAGYHFRLNPLWGLRLEARDNLLHLDFRGYEPPVAAGFDQAATLSERTPDHLWEILIQIHVQL